MARKRADLADAPAAQRPDAEPAPALRAAAPAATATAPPPAAAAQRRESSPSAAEPSAGAVAEASADRAVPLHIEPRAMQGNTALGKVRAADAGSAPLAALLAGIGQQPERWRWQRGNAEAQTMTPALQRWLAQLDRSTASRWRTPLERAPHETTGAVRLLRDDVLVATLGFAGSGVWVDTAATAAAPVTSMMAMLPHASVEALRTALDEATR
jgi:hypothetical protein